MRKAYQKPLLFAEQFAMNEHISKSCLLLTNFGGGCPIAVDGLTFFTSTPDCSADAISMFEFNGYKEGEDDPLLFLINEINPTCYNSLADFHQMFVS